MAVEYELKFKATSEALIALAKEYSGYPMVAYEMSTTYYDTPTGALSAKHYTLRRRMENGQSVCTLKIPAAGFGRQEFEVCASNIQEAIRLICEAGAPEDFGQLVQPGVVAVCSARFYRRAFTLEFPDCTLELALDKGIFYGGGQQWPFREIEVELKKGEPSQADVFAMDLAARYHLTGEPRSKFARALALSKGEQL